MKFKQPGAESTSLRVPAGDSRLTFLHEPSRVRSEADRWALRSRAKKWSDIDWYSIKFTALNSTVSTTFFASVFRSAEFCYNTVSEAAQILCSFAIDTLHRVVAVDYCKGD